MYLGSCERMAEIGGAAGCFRGPFHRIATHESRRFKLSLCSCASFNDFKPLRAGCFLTFFPPFSHHLTSDLSRLLDL
jgi:hypothetical protein